MHDARRHRNDEPAYCWFCKNFHLVPTGGAGTFRCDNKNTPEQLLLCFNYEPRELPEQSFEILADSRPYVVGIDLASDNSTK